MTSRGQKRDLPTSFNRLEWPLLFIYKWRNRSKWKQLRYPELSGRVNSLNGCKWRHQDEGKASQIFWIYWTSDLPWQLRDSDKGKQLAYYEFSGRVTASLAFSNDATRAKWKNSWLFIRLGWLALTFTNGVIEGKQLAYSVTFSNDVKRAKGKNSWLFSRLGRLALTFTNDVIEVNGSNSDNQN